MKRFLTTILSAVMALSVCACGGGSKTAETNTAETTVGEEDRVKSILVGTDWRNLQRESAKLVFKDDGTGMYYDYDCTWELKDNNIIEITYDQKVMGIGTVSYEKAIIPFEFIDDDLPKVIRTDKWQNLQTYISAENYNTVRGELLDSMIEQAEEFSRDKAISSFDSNKKRAENYYDNTAQKMTTIVREIEDNRVEVSEELYNGLPLNSIDLKGIDEDVMIKLNKGDEITFYGYLSYYSEVGGHSISMNGIIVNINGEKLY